MEKCQRSHFHTCNTLEVVCSFSLTEPAILCQAGKVKKLQLYWWDSYTRKSLQCVLAAPVAPALPLASFHYELLLSQFRPTETTSNTKETQQRCSPNVLCSGGNHHVTVPDLLCISHTDTCKAFLHSQTMNCYLLNHSPPRSPQL